MESQLKKANQTIGYLQKQLKDLGGTARTMQTSVHQGFQGVHASLTRFHGMVATAHRAWHGLLALAGAGSLGGLVRQSTQLGDSISDMATQVGVSVEALQRLRYAAQQNGGSAELMDRALNVLNERLGDAANKSTEAQTAFARLGLRWQDLQRVGTEQAMLAVAEAVSRIEDPTQRAAAITGVFGERSRALTNALLLGSRGLVATGQEAERFGAVLSSSAVKALAAANDRLDKFALQLQVAVARAIVQLTPVLTAFAESFDRIVEAILAGNTALGDLTATEQGLVQFFQTLHGLFGGLVTTIQQTAKEASGIATLFRKLFGEATIPEQIAQVQQRLEVLSRQPDSPARYAEQERARDQLVELQRRLPIAGGGGGGGGRGAMGRADRGRPPLLPPVVIHGEGDLPTGGGRGRGQTPQERYAETLRELEGFAAAMRQAGQPVDLLQERIRALAATIRDRLGEGTKAGSAEIRALVTELGQLESQAMEAATQKAQRFGEAMRQAGMPTQTLQQQLSETTSALQDRFSRGADESDSVVQSLIGRLRMLNEQALRESMAQTAAWGAAMRQAGQPVDALQEQIDRVSHAPAQSWGGCRQCRDPGTLYRAGRTSGSGRASDDARSVAAARYTGSALWG
jgi:hypothetical protein